MSKIENIEEGAGGKAGTVKVKEDSVRMARKKRATRAKLREAAYKVMSRKGIEATTLKEITEEADVGFGTIYNYFTDKDEIASQVLDCIIHDMGRRNDVATANLMQEKPVVVNSISARLVVREAIDDPMWRWWVQRPDLLVDRMRRGFGPFGLRDLRLGAKSGAYTVIGEDYEATWSAFIWTLVGSMCDVVNGEFPRQHKNMMIEANLRILGVSIEEAKEISVMPLPDYPKADIDFSFTLPDE